MTRARSEPGGPFLKWAGGKGRLLEDLERAFPAKFKAYHEPFLGAAAVYFHLAWGGRLSEAHLSDVNRDLVVTFRSVRNQTKALIAELTVLRAAHSEDSYYAARERFNSGELSQVERAALVIYLNKTGYNGLYRVNKSGGFNVPFGRHKDPRVFDEKVLRAASSALATATIENRDFGTVLDRAAPGDLVYFDPPYDPLNHTAYFTSYASTKFGIPEQERLAEVFRKLDERGVFVVLSNHDTPLVRKLYGEYERRVVHVTRLINSNASRRNEAIPEVIVLGHSAGG